MAEPHRLVARPLTAEAFAPYGEVLDGPGPERSSREWDVPRFDAAKLCLSMSRRPASALPFQTHIMERHPQSLQTFIPLRVSRFLVIVAPATPEAKLPQLRDIRAFIGRSGQGLSYRAGTWHHPFAVLDQDGEYASLMFRDGGPRDEEFVDLPQPLLISAGDA